jgi:hypothetical protein
LDPDPLFRGKDPGIRIHTKMSWIPNTGSKSFEPYISRNSYEKAMHFFLFFESQKVKRNVKKFKNSGPEK